MNTKSLPQMNVAIGSLGMASQSAPSGVRPKTEMERATERLADARAALQSKVDHLRERLEPVRVVREAGCESVAGDDASSPGSILALEIWTEAKRIESAAAQIGVMISELEI